MKNRERLLKTNEYDLLLRISQYMDMDCIIDAINSKNGYIEESKKRTCNFASCSECIQHWLNEEEGGL